MFSDPWHRCDGLAGQKLRENAEISRHLPDSHAGKSGISRRYGLPVCQTGLAAGFITPTALGRRDFSTLPLGG